MDTEQYALPFSITPYISTSYRIINSKVGAVPIFLLLTGLLFFFSIGNLNTYAQYQAQGGDEVIWQSALVWRTDAAGDYVLPPMPANAAYELIDPIATRGRITSISANWEFKGDVRMEVSADNGLNYIPVVNGVPLRAQVPVSTSDPNPLVTGNQLKWRVILGAASELIEIRISYSDTSGVAGSFGAPELSGFKTRKFLEIENPSDQELFNYQIKIKVAESANAVNYDVHCDGNITADFKDIRFTALDGQTLLPHYLEKTIPPKAGQGSRRIAHFWVKIPQLPASGASIYIYYVNPDSADTSDNDSVFDGVAFDDWLIARGSGAVELVVGSAGAEEEVYPAEFLNTTLDKKGNLVLSDPENSGQYMTPLVATSCNISAITPVVQVPTSPKGGGSRDDGSPLDAAEHGISLDISADGGLSFKSGCRSAATYRAPGNFNPGQELLVRANFPATETDTITELEAIKLGYSVGPSITSGHIYVSGASLPAGRQAARRGTYKTGDTVVVKWDNSSLGDNNAGILNVSCDFSTLGGLTQVKMKDKAGDNIYIARYELPQGLNITGNIFVTAGNQCGATSRDGHILDVDYQGYPYGHTPGGTGRCRGRDKQVYSFRDRYRSAESKPKQGYETALQDQVW